MATLRSSQKFMSFVTEKRKVLFRNVFPLTSFSLGVYLLNNEAQAPKERKSREPMKRVVVLGTGWAAMSFLKNLKSQLYDVQIISPKNYFVFTPLLSALTVGKVEASSLVEPVRNMSRPVRSIFEKKVPMHYQQAECYKIDPYEKVVYCKNGDMEFLVNYDYLVIAIGLAGREVNTPGVNEMCIYLKEVEDCFKIREAVINSLGKANRIISDEDRRKLLHFVVIGGGPTGIKLASQLHDYIEEELVKSYPLCQGLFKVSYFESIENRSNRFQKRLSKFAEGKYAKKGLDLKIGSKVISVDDKEMLTLANDGGSISAVPYSVAIWAESYGTHPVATDLMKQLGKDDGYLLATDEWLKVQGSENIYALGDCANITTSLEKNELKDADFRIIPLSAKVAAQQGSYLARCFNNRWQCQACHVCDRHLCEPYRYTHLSRLAPLGDTTRLPWDHISDRHSSRWVWDSAYFSNEVSWRTRILVCSNLIRSRLFGQDTSGF